MGKAYTKTDINYTDPPASGGDTVNSFAEKSKSNFDDIIDWFDDVVENDGNLKISKLSTDAANGLDKLDSSGKVATSKLYTNTASGVAGLDSDTLIPYIYNSNRVKRICDHQNPYLIANPPASWKMETTFASEISGYADTAAWLKARCTANDFTDILPGDYFEHAFASESSNRKARVLGVDTYRSSSDSLIPAHIDFCSGLYYGSAGFKWNTTNDNNGTSSNPSPYRASNLFSVYTSTILPLFPSWLSGKMTEKRALLPSRYSSSGTLTDDTSWAWNSMGKVWAFFEEEVTGQVYCQTKGLTGYFKHYPMFAIQPAWTAIFGRSSFWGAGAYSGYSDFACLFSNDGHCGADYASYSLYGSLGFRISA